MSDDLPGLSHPRGDAAHELRVICGKLGGRPRRLDLSGFRIGQSITLPWRVDFRGDRLPDQQALHQQVYREGRRMGQKFQRVGRPMGLLVTRIE
jgi:hypothetical protein